jgi:hypothetical protein
MCSRRAFGGSPSFKQGELHRPLFRSLATRLQPIRHLFDRGFIGFEDNGNVIISPVAHRPSLERMGIEVRDTLNVGSFTAAQRHFLEYHRDVMLPRSAR